MAARKSARKSTARTTPQAAVAPPRTLEEARVSTSADVGQDEVQDRLEAEQERGYRGTTPDPRPNEDYTVAGVTGDNPPTGPALDDAGRVVQPLAGEQ